MGIFQTKKEIDTFCRIYIINPQIGDLKMRKHPAAYYQEDFTFTNARGYHRGKQGFQAFNSNGENVGIVFMCDDKRILAYEHCELCIYSPFHERYGEWHIIKSHGGRIKWNKLCEILSQKSTLTLFID